MRYLIAKPWLIALLVLTSLLACSPAYVLRAGLEEAGILFRRKSIDKLITSSETDETTRSKLRLVLEARDFAAAKGLVPKGSFSQYSKVDRDVLVWVLSASPKTTLVPYTWWFPIVGSIPYKGFFDKEDGISAQQQLIKKGLDTYLRPSSAFSTLGWFNDPLLSTTLRADEVTLVDTVIHEILHNTVWIKDNVPFNETLANFVGAQGAKEFFLNKYGADHAWTKAAANRWRDELHFARFIEETINSLNTIYNSKQNETDVLEEREKVLKAAVEKWASRQAILKTKGYTIQTLNNAFLLAQQTYLTKPWLFAELFELSNNSLETFVSNIKSIKERAKSDPYEELNRLIMELKLKSIAQEAVGS